jgi:hypothetical protein
MDYEGRFWRAPLAFGPLPVEIEQAAVNDE